MVNSRNESVAPHFENIPMSLWSNSWPDPVDSDFRIFVPGPCAKAAGNLCCVVAGALFQKSLWLQKFSFFILRISFFFLLSSRPKIMTMIGRRPYFLLVSLGCKLFWVHAEALPPVAGASPGPQSECNAVTRAVLVWSVETADRRIDVEKCCPISTCEFLQPFSRNLVLALPFDVEQQLLDGLRTCNVYHKCHLYLDAI